MIPVDQRIFDPGRGDCLSACLASIFELPYEQVPRFMADAFDAGTPELWYRQYQAWLRSIRFHERTYPWDSFGDWRGLEDALALLSVPSQRFPGTYHSVVCTWTATEGDGLRMWIVHDPNPGNAPYPENVQPSHVTFYVPHSPRIIP